MSMFQRIRSWFSTPSGAMLMFDMKRKISSNILKKNGKFVWNYSNGVIIHNNETTKIEFVVNIIQKYFDLRKSDAEMAAIIIHSNGSVLFELDTVEKAERIVTSIKRDAAENGYDLKCQVSMARQGTPADAKNSAVEL